MNSTSRATICRAATAGGIVAALFGLGVAPAQASETSGCTEGSRTIEVAAVDIDRAVTNGTRGRAEITLRSNPEKDCFWGLIAGPGEIWLERSTPYSTLTEQNLHRRANKENDITHTAATTTTAHYVRACGRAYNGTESDGSSVGGGVDVSKQGGVSGSLGGDQNDIYEFADNTVCTSWASADVIRPNF